MSIYLNITGGTVEEKSLVEDAFYFALEKLMPRKKNLDVEINITDMADDVDGFHEYIDKGEHNLELQAGLIEEDLATVVFHEMVHVRQAERGQMKDKGLIKVWDGVEYVSMYSTTEEYMSLPWEKEAYELQEKLFNEYVSQLG